MSVNFANLWTDLEPLVKNTWTDVSRFIRISQMDVIELRKFLVSGGITYPFCLMDVGEYIPNDEYGVQNEEYYVDISFYYVISRDISTASLGQGVLADDTVETKCKALADALYAYTGGKFQVIIDPKISISARNMFNRSLGKPGYNMFAGCVTARFIIGEIL